MKKQFISSGSIFEKEVAFSRAVVVGPMIFVSGCTGFDYHANTIAEGVVEQTEQTFKNIEFALSEAGSSLKDVVRVLYVFKSPAAFAEAKPIIRSRFETINPACTVICAQLTDERLQVEIEVTAIKHI